MNVRVSYLFSRNKKIGSRIISWASGLLIKDLEKIPSHMAILIQIDGFPEDIVFESTLDSGVRLAPFKVWSEHNELCYGFVSDKKINISEIFDKVNEYWGRKYDWPGICYFAVCFLKHILFKSPFPKENAWQSNDKFFCNELGGEISGYSKYSMVTPAKMCSDFRKSLAILELKAQEEKARR